jgi:hypothetical protein
VFIESEMGRVKVTVTQAGREAGILGLESWGEGHLGELVFRVECGGGAVPPGRWIRIKPELEGEKEGPA